MSGGGSRGAGGSLLRSDVVRGKEAAERGICFHECRCGSQAAPYEIISPHPRRQGWAPRALGK